MDYKVGLSVLKKFSLEPLVECQPFIRWPDLERAGYLTYKARTVNGEFKLRPTMFANGRVRCVVEPTHLSSRFSSVTALLNGVVKGYHQIWLDNQRFCHGSFDYYPCAVARRVALYFCLRSTNVPKASHVGAIRLTEQVNQPCIWDSFKVVLGEMPLGAWLDLYRDELPGVDNFLDCYFSVMAS